MFDVGAKAKVRRRRRSSTSRPAEKRRALLEHEAKQLLALHGAAGHRGPRWPQSADEAVGLARKIGRPGGPEDRLAGHPAQERRRRRAAGAAQPRPRSARLSQEIVANARRFNPSADIRGVLVSPMAPDGLEVIIGTKIDDQFGPVIMFGIGGILVEVLKDVAFRVLPISPLIGAQDDR